MAAERRPVTVLIAWVSGVIGMALALAVLVFGTSVAVAGSLYVAVPVALATVAYATVSVAIALLRPENRLHWLTRLLSIAGPALALSLMARDIGEASVRDLATFSLGPVFRWIGGWLFYLPIGVQLTLLPLLFPTGSPPSARWRPLGWYAAAIILSLMLVSVLRPPPGGPEPGFDPFGVGGPVGDLLTALREPLHIALLSAVLGCVASVVVRFRRARGIERQQMKWFVSAAALGILGPLLSVVSGLLVTVAGLPNDNPLEIVAGLGFLVSFVLVPVAVGIAILRYRLYDIDVLINRTLIYGALTAALAATYFGAVALLQTALRPFTSGNDLAVAGSTLAVVVLFHPVRRLIQTAVDRRFSRSRYDAARTLDAFGARLRDEVDLDAVRADLLDVVHDTVRPAHASVWLRERG